MTYRERLGAITVTAVATGVSLLAKTISNLYERKKTLELQLRLERDQRVVQHIIDEIGAIGREIDEKENELKKHTREKTARNILIAGIIGVTAFGLFT